MGRDKWQNASYCADMSSQREEGTEKRKPCRAGLPSMAFHQSQFLPAGERQVCSGLSSSQLALDWQLDLATERKLVPQISVQGNWLLVICYCRAGWGMQSLSVYSATPHKNRLLSPGKKGECMVGTQSSLRQVSSLCDPQSELLPPS